MFLKTFSTTMKRIFRSPAMLFSIPAIVIMLQQRTQIISKNDIPDNLFIHGGYFFQIYAQTPADYVINQMLFNAILIPITHCIPIVIAVILSLVLRDFYNTSERDILFATNIPYGKYYLSKLLCAFVTSFGILVLFVAAYLSFILPQLPLSLPFGETLLRTVTLTLVLGVTGILQYMAIGILVTALTKQVIAGSAVVVVYSMMGGSMATTMLTSNSPFWTYTYFPQGKLWKFFYMWGTPWHEDFLANLEVSAVDMWTCIAVTALIAIVSLVSGYILFGQERVKAKR